MIRIAESPPYDAYYGYNSKYRLAPVFCDLIDPNTGIRYWMFSGAKWQIVHHNPRKPFRQFYLKKDIRFWRGLGTSVLCYVVKSRGSSKRFKLSANPLIEGVNPVDPFVAPPPGYIPQAPGSSVIG